MGCRTDAAARTAVSISDGVMEQAEQQNRLALKTFWPRKPCCALPAVYPQGGMYQQQQPLECLTSLSPPSVFLLLANPAMEVRQVIFFFFCFVVQLRLLSCRKQRVGMATAEAGYLAMQNNRATS